MHRFAPLFSLFAAVGLAAAAAACTASNDAGSGDQTAADTTGDAGTSAGTPPLEATINPAIVTALAAGGLTVDTLPTDLDAIVNDPDHSKLGAVMKSFTIALGVSCTGCHVEADGGRPDFGAPTPQKNVAKRMWSDFVGQLKKADGSAIYCDTCHQGKEDFLDRSNPHAVGPWMKANFVAGLARKDGTAQSCTNCHGSPFNGNFLDGWEQNPTTTDAGTP